ncbi:hypothetical protein GCM10027261_14280 [Geodermatophilus arenarius]|uniref:Uncharacterized protein n=1 Tax=Geodermatophilus arenarius TaxID=1137990 RepID=A0ABV9LI11_9ACTN
MTLTAAPAAPTSPVTAPARPRRWLAAYCGGVLAAVLPYGAGVLLPYFVNGLHRLPLAEVASGRHDPKLLWPSYTGSGGLLDLAGFLSLAWTPLALVALVVLGPLAAWRTRHRPWLAACFVVLAAACVAALGWLMGLTSAALLAWRMD